MEKFTTEYIEQYLEGKLNDADRRKIEAAMAINPELREEVALQKALVQKMNRKMLTNMIHDAHLRHAGKSSFDIRNMFGKWILGSLLLTGIVAGTWIYLSNKKENTDEISSNYPKVNVIAAPIILTGQTETTERPQVVFTNYTFIAEKGAKIIDGRSGTVISIPANALKIKQSGQLAKGEVTLKYREFRTQADIALSNIPMTYKDKNFNSAGMFEILAVQNTDTLEIVNGGKVDIDFVMTKNETGIGFYFLNPENNQWELIESLDKKKDSIVTEKVPVYSNTGLYNRYYPYNDTTIDLRDPFVRSMNYQKANLKERTVLPKGFNYRDTLNANSAFNNSSINKAIGIDEKSEAIIDIKRVPFKDKRKYHKPSVSNKNRESSFIKFFKKLFSTKKNKEVKTTNNDKINESKSFNNVYTFFIINGKLKYGISRHYQFTELKALENAEFSYSGTADLDYLTGKTITDIRLIRDTTVYNRFMLELKSDGKILKYPLSLQLPANEGSPDFSVYDKYVLQRNIRLIPYEEKAKALKDLVDYTNASEDSLSEFLKYGEDNVYQMARLIMNEKELKMSKEEWYASLKNNKEVAQRVKSHLDSIVAYGEKPNDYVRKLIKNNSDNASIIANIQYRDQLIKRQIITNNYNTLITGLRIKGFGIYNCDQIYRIDAPVVVQGRFYNEDTKNELQYIVNLSVIDTRINGAFRFNSKSFTCSSKTRTSILIFTMDKKMFYLSPDKWEAKQIKKSGPYSFLVKDITKEVKTPEDLQKILEQNSL